MGAERASNRSRIKRSRISSRMALWCHGRLHLSIRNGNSSTCQCKVRLSGVNSIKPYLVSVVLSRAWGGCLSSQRDFAALGQFFASLVRRRTRVVVISRAVTETPRSLESDVLWEDSFVSKTLRDTDAPMASIPAQKASKLGAVVTQTPSKTGSSNSLKPPS